MQRVRCADKSFKIESYRFDKFLDRLYIAGECIEFRGSKSHGYGSFSYAPYRAGGAHVFSYRAFVGPIRRPLVIDHICRNRACVRPDHLRQITNRENILCGNGATARNARKSQCVNGHEYTPENTYRDSRGRRCRTCRSIKKKAWDIKNREHRLAYRREQKRKKGVSDD